MKVDRLGLGVVGLGRAFMLMLPTFLRHPAIRLVAAADPRVEARRRFSDEFSARAYGSVEDLCADPDVHAVYIASPHQFHPEHAAMAASRGKHILVEKPMAVTLDACQAMVEAAGKAGIHLIVGHSHSFDAPYLRARDLVTSGQFGRVRMINACNFTDFLYRPRRREELVTGMGGGVVFSQGAHQVDIVRLLGGGRVRTVRAATGAWDPARPTEGAYSAFLTFEDGVFATLTYSGYGRFDTDEFCGWIGEMGRKKDPGSYGAARDRLRRIKSPDEEEALKTARTYGSSTAPVADSGETTWHNHFGLVVVSCERADLRPVPQGVMIYGDERRLEAVPPSAAPRAEVIDELVGAALHDRPPLHSGQWGMATMEVCLAILDSARQNREIALSRQVALPTAAPH